MNFPVIFEEVTDEAGLASTVNSPAPAVNAKDNTTNVQIRIIVDLIMLSFSSLVRLINFIMRSNCEGNVFQYQRIIIVA